jgi:hypothetical protein
MASAAVAIVTVPIARGLHSVAAQLSIACETPRIHIRHILGRLGAHDPAHAITIAVMRGMLRLRDWTDGGEAYRRAADV